MGAAYLMLLAALAAAAAAPAERVLREFDERDVV